LSLRGPILAPVLVLIYMRSKFLIESFWQTEFNCVSVALIKAVILRYGLNRIFHYRRADDGYIITLKNKDQLAISLKDIDRLAQKCKIGFREESSRNQKRILDSIKRQVLLCFAVMVHRIQTEGYEGKKYTEQNALKLLNKRGMSTRQMHDLLGLSRKSKSADHLTRRRLALFRKKKSVLLYSSKHIVVVSKGYYDDYGEAVKLGDSFPILEGRKASGWFELK
jgi:hypothetical protein